ncbi:MAG: hypothetical protein IKW19_07365 [Akkermansia sp.]|nr:hypothetical protein [Akkermansia sp.]
MNTKRTFSEICLRLFCLFFGLFMLAQGIAFTVIADLGTDAITSPALVCHLVLGDVPGGMGYSFFTVGRLLICVHVLLVLMQILLLRRNYRPVQLLQVVMGVILGVMLDFCLSYTRLLPVEDYTFSLAYTLVGCVFCAFGIFTYVKADMVPLSAEGFCLALSRTFSWRFSRVKVAVDCSMIAIAVVASLIIWGNVVGVREGSLICAVSTGYIIGFFFKVCPIWDNLFAKVRGNAAAGDEPELS